MPPKDPMGNYLKYRAQNCARVFVYLTIHPCVDCGESDPLVLDFDHVRGVKRKNISAMLSGTYAWKTIAAEIEKCDVRCANCHRRVTAQRGESKQWLTEEMLELARAFFL